MTYENKNWYALNEYNRKALESVKAKIDRALAYGPDMTGSTAINLVDALFVLESIVKNQRIGG